MRGEEEMKEQKRRSQITWKVLPCAIMLVVMFVSPCMGVEDPTKYPSKPISMIIPYGPGAMNDTTGRKLAELTSKILGQPIVVVNKPGGGAVLGVTSVANAAPDGYTIGIAVYSALVVIPHTRSVPYNTKEDFTWIMAYGDTTMFFCVRADSRWKTFKDFIAEARKNPGKLNYSTVGTMGAQHIFMEYVFSREKVKLNHVPGEASEISTNLLGGHIDAAMAILKPWLGKGGLRALAILEKKRLDMIPDVPTFSELGYEDEIEAPRWIGLFAPKGLNPFVQKKLDDAFRKASEDPSFKELCAQWSLEPHFRDSASFKAAVLRDFDSQRKVLKELGFIK